MVVRLLSANIPTDLKHGSAGQNSSRKWCQTLGMWVGCAISSLKLKSNVNFVFLWHCFYSPDTSRFQLFNQLNWYWFWNLQFVLWSHTHHEITSDPTVHLMYSQDFIVSCLPIARWMEHWRIFSTPQYLSCQHHDACGFYHHRPPVRPSYQLSQLSHWGWLMHWFQQKHDVHRGLYCRVVTETAAFDGLWLT